MHERQATLTKYRDPAGNVYGVEKAIRNGRWIVVRTNAGGNRHGAKQFCAAGNAEAVQKLLDAEALRSGWKAVGK